MYNENDVRVAAWLQELINQGHLPEGNIDGRSIEELQPADCEPTSHFFAGIGGWPYALSLAGWPTDRDVWTGSCPCQPFSNAGQRKGHADKRDLWPIWYELIKECRPAVCFGEQVASNLGREWLSGVRADLEALGYRFGAADLCAASVGSPHIRQRLYWVADWLGDSEGQQAHATEPGQLQSSQPSRTSGLVHPEGNGADGREPEISEAGRNAGGLEYPEGTRLPNQQRFRDGDEGQSGFERSSGVNVWSNYDIIPCGDGKARRIESGSFPLAPGIPRGVGRYLPRVPGFDPDIKLAVRNRATRLKGYGNAIIPQVAAAFVRAYLDA